MKKSVNFMVNKQISSFETNSFALPVCKTAYYFCLLARKEQLSLRDLYLIEKIGFCIKITNQNDG